MQALWIDESVCYINNKILETLIECELYIKPYVFRVRGKSVTL